MNMELCSTLATIAVMIYIASCICPASSICTKVDDTTDKCRGSDIIVNHKRYTKGSYVHIDLPHFQTEIYWYCGSSEERTGWRGVANRLTFSFSTDGTIFWTIYRCRRCSIVETTQDSCKSASFIQLLVANQRINKGTFKQVVRLPVRMTSLYWWCGSGLERTAWGPPTKELSISYFFDGKIRWEIKRCD